MNVTLRQMKVFESVARNLSYTRAASELFLTQPAVSMQIRQLERQLGVSLFERVGKRVHLTEAGKEVYQYSRSIAQTLDEMETLLADLKGLGSGRLRISVASTANYLVPSLLAEFHRHYPGITVSLDVTNRESLIGQLRDNTVDIVIMGQPPAGLDVDARAFMENPLVVVAPPDHPLAREKNVPLERLREEVFLVREPGSGTRIAMERFFAERGIQLKTGMEVGSNEAIKQSVQAGLGLGLLSRATIEQELALKRLTVLWIAEFPIMRHWYIMHRHGKRLSAAADAFKRFLLQDAGRPPAPA
ncbi:MAG: LysR substrate-binding domain-containing protein [Pseudomonadota bacterium]|nr:LysR substrate-binding domain-containing protein [Pseudomonadota bacterium]